MGRHIDNYTKVLVLMVRTFRRKMLSLKTIEFGNKQNLFIKGCAKISNKN